MWYRILFILSLLLFLVCCAMSRDPSRYPLRHDPVGNSIGLTDEEQIWFYDHESSSIPHSKNINPSCDNIDE